MSKLSSKKVPLVIVCFVSALLIAFAILSTILLVFYNKNTDAFTNTNTTDYITVSEIWDDSSKSFNKENFSTLLKYLSSDGSLDGVNTSRQTAEDIRGYTYNGKSSGKAVVVTLGGYKWQVVYLTRTNDTSGDLIATLLMIDADGKAYLSYDPNHNNGSGYYTPGYAPSMYGTTYMRAVTLNNGGEYIEISSGSSNPTTTKTASPSSSHKYSLYTVESKGLTQYLCQPQNVWYQTQSQGNNNVAGYVLNNESLATDLTGYSSLSSTYQKTQYYTQWGQDYLWLPSLSEMGTNDSYSGIWGLSISERAATDSVASYVWTRTAYNSYNSYSLYANGKSYDDPRSYLNEGVRPALHLNLDNAGLNASCTITENANNTSYGTVTGGGTYFYNTQATLTATPNTGYEFKGWDTNSDGIVDITENPYTFTVTSDKTITAMFEAIPILITGQSNDTNYGTVVGAGEYLKGTIVQLIASAKANCGFKYWIDSNDQIYYDNPLRFTAQNDIIFTAVFTNNLFEGTAVVASEGGEVRLTGYPDNTDTVHISAVAYKGYTFAGWETNDNTDLSAYGMSADITYNLIKGKVIIARFIPISNNNTNGETDNQEDIL